jgi:hypothetical protein
MSMIPFSIQNMEFNSTVKGRLLKEFAKDMKYRNRKFFTGTENHTGRFWKD